MKKYISRLFFLSMILPATNLLGQTNNFKTLFEAKGLQVGDLVQDFTAINLHDSLFRLSDALQSGPVVVIFIRGQWCPVCNKHISSLNDSLHYIYQKGASVIVVSPEKSEFLKRTAEKTGAEFTLLYDNGYKISDAFDVTFQPDSLTRAFYNTVLSAKLKESHSNDSERLPIPATFIIGKDFKIKWRHFDPDYKKRASVADIVKNL